MSAMSSALQKLSEQPSLSCRTAEYPIEHQTTKKPRKKRCRSAAWNSSLQEASQPSADGAPVLRGSTSEGKEPKPDWLAAGSTAALDVMDEAAGNSPSQEEVPRKRRFDDANSDSSKSRSSEERLQEDWYDQCREPREMRAASMVVDPRDTVADLRDFSSELDDDCSSEEKGSNSINDCRAALRADEFNIYYRHWYGGGIPLNSVVRCYGRCYVWNDDLRDVFRSLPRGTEFAQALGELRMAGCSVESTADANNNEEPCYEEHAKCGWVTFAPR